MIPIHRLLAPAACLIPYICSGQSAVPTNERAACTRFLGLWSGTWSQGFYGTQRIHVTHVSDACVATLAYSPTEVMPQVTHEIPINAGVMLFGCNMRGGTCRLEVQGAELRVTYTDPSGFVNVGTFRRRSGP